MFFTKPRVNPPTLVEKSTFSFADKTISLEDIWTVLTDIKSKINFHDSTFKEIKYKLVGFGNTFGDYKKSLNSITNNK